MKCLGFAMIALVGLAGCSSENASIDADAAAIEPAPQQPLRLGAGDDLGWSLTNTDRAFAGTATGGVGPTYASHGD